MSAWKLPAAVAAAMLLTVGVGSGVAWVQAAGGKGSTASAAEPDPKTGGGQEAPQEDPNKKAIEAVLKSLTPQIEALNEYVRDRDKQLTTLANELQDRVKRQRELSLEDAATIQKRYSAAAEALNAALREIRRDEQAGAEMNERVKKIDEASRQELANLLEDIQIDPNSKDGVRLGVMYRKQAELESKIRELGVQVKRTERKRPGADVELSGAKDELELLLTDIEALEKQAQTRASEVVKARFARELETRKQRGATEVQLAKQSIERKQAAVRADESNLRELLMLGFSVGAIESEITLIKDKIQKVEWDIKDNQDKRAKLELLRTTYPLRPPEMTIADVSKELAEIRRELADLKKK